LKLKKDMANKNAVPPKSAQFKPGWKSGKTKAIKVPMALEKEIRAIALILDENPGIFPEILEFAKTLAK
jgi:hypothetical protein